MMTASRDWLRQLAAEQAMLVAWAILAKGATRPHALRQILLTTRSGRPRMTHAEGGLPTEGAAILSLAPWSCDRSGMAEIAGSEPRVEPEHEAVNIVNRNSQPIAQRSRVWHHVRALE